MVREVIIITMLIIGIINSVVMFTALKCVSDFDDEVEKYYSKQISKN